MLTSESLSFLKQLLDTPGPSGFEAAPAKVWRAEAAGFVNALSQFVLVAWIVWEAVVRLRHPGEILSGVMLVVAVAGLLVNVLVLRTLHGHAHDDVNLAGASLHVLGDLLGSVAA